MFKINKEAVVDEILLNKMISTFLATVQPNLIKYKNYYDGIQNICDKSYSDASKPCNKTVTNYCKNISDLYCGYLASAGFISYRSEYDIDAVMDILRYNDYQDEDSSFLLDALVYGTAAELMYTDENAKIRFKLIAPTSCFGIFDDSLTNDLLYFVRWYKVSEWDDSNLYHVDVYSDNTIKTYECNGIGGALRFLEENPHYFGQCPANIFFMPDEKSIFDCVMSLQDSYNELYTSEIDDYSAFVDAYLVITGADVGEEEATKMRQNRILNFPEDSVNANWLTKNSSDAQVENMLERTQASIYRTASCPDFSSESFTGGVSSGIAIRYKLCGMETRAAKIATLMKKALQRRIEIICGVVSMKLGEEIFRDIQIDFKRNIPDDNTATVNLVNALKGTVSDATLLAQLPFISDVQAELDALNEQKQAEMEIYSFDHTHEDGDVIAE